MTEIDASSTGAGDRVAALDAPSSIPMQARHPLFWLSRAALCAAVVVVAGVALAYLALSLPSADDFVRGGRPREVGWGRYFIWVYFYWQGRWAATAFETFAMSRLNPTRFYPLLMGGLAVVWLLAVYQFCRLATSTASRTYTLALTTTLAAVLWAGVPSTTETVYWFTGGDEYFLSMSVAALVVICLIRVDAGGQSTTASRITTVALALLAFCVPGLHELYGAMLLLALAVGTAAAYLTKDRNRERWLVVLVSCAIGLVVSVAAPGNLARAAHDGGTTGGHMEIALPLTVRQLLKYGRAWLFDPKVIAASFVVAFSPTLGAAGARSSTDTPSRIASFPWRWVLPPVWLTMVTLNIFGPTYAFGKGTPPRVQSAGYVIFVLGWLATVYLWTRPVAAGRPGAAAQRFWRDFPSPHVTAVACLLLAAALLLTGNVPVGAKDLYPRAWRWHTAVERRFATLRAAGGHQQSDVVFTLLPPSPRALQSGEITHDFRDYHNWGLQVFYCVHTVQLAPDPRAATTATTTPSH